MKVVLFCGGLGLRIRDAEDIPKPMVTNRVSADPVACDEVLRPLWSQGLHSCAWGYRADVVKNYFVNYNECVSNDFVLSSGGNKLELFNSDIHDWRITFADTGINSNIGQRLKAVEKYLEGEDEFLANYSDGLTDLPLPEQLEHFRQQGKIASFLVSGPTLAITWFRCKTMTGGLVSGIHAINNGTVRINGGFFIFKKKIFDYIRDKEELVDEPFQRLVRGKAADWLSVRRFLGEHGHLQGQAAPGKPLCQRRCSVGSVEEPQQRPSDCGSQEQVTSLTTGVIDDCRYCPSRA